MQIPDFLLAELNKIAGPHRRHLVVPDAELSAVGVDATDRLTLACSIDEALLAEIPDAELWSWHTIGDVVQSAMARGG